MSVDQELNVVGLNCPLPILKTKKALSKILSGQTLRVISDDPESCRDIPIFARKAGHELIQQYEENQTFVFELRKK